MEAYRGDLIESKQAIEKACSALSLVEQLESCIDGLEELEKLIPSKYAEELDIQVTKIKTLVKILDDNEELAPELVRATKISNLGSSKIERLGLAGQVIRMRELQKLNYTEIAEQLQIDKVSVSRFCKYYDSIPLSQKAKYQRASIFDTTAQYEEISTMIYRQLARLEDSDAENHVKYLSELRQVIKAAHEWMDRVQTQNEMQEVKQAIVEILSNSLPEQRDRILKQFNAIGLKGFRTVSALESV